VPLPQPPAPERGWAYFLDVDGTLVELALTPDAVHVSGETHDLVHDLHAITGGAVALVSGRAIADVDRLFPGGVLPVAGQHGLERRDGRGIVSRVEIPTGALREARAALASLAAEHDGLLLEDKGRSLAMHYRLAPQHRQLVHDAVRALADSLGDAWTVQPGKRVFELRPAGADKGAAIRAFLQDPPFRGRTPVFVGDDATDEHGFAVVNRRGGISIKVGEGATCARSRLAHVRAVERRLRGATDSA
jgi:trehalose 6-phosphate phosphatase